MKKQHIKWNIGHASNILRKKNKVYIFINTDNYIDIFKWIYSVC